MFSYWQWVCIACIGSWLPDVSEHAAVTWCNHHAWCYSSTKRCKALDSILCLVAAKVYKKVPNLLLPADSYHLPYVRYINDLVAEFPLSAHTLVSPLTAPTQIVQPSRGTPADSQQSVASTVVTGEAPASAAADEAAATAAPPSSTAVPSVNTAVPLPLPSLSAAVHQLPTTSLI